jgi:hypothetical protein
LHFTADNGPVDSAIAGLIAAAGGIQHPEIVREMILAALKAGQESRERADLKLMNSTLKEMRFTTKVFQPYRRQRKVSVFGSARLATGTPLYAMAHALGRELVARGYMVITGGGPGIMQAVNEGAGAQHSFGVNIRLPFEQTINPVVAGNPRQISYKYFFNRKVAFLKEADAIVLFPGGFGTLDEAMESITLLQTGKRQPLPLVLLDLPHSRYWQRLLDFVHRELLPRDFIQAADLGLFYRAGSASDAAEHISAFYRRYHSQRYVGTQLVLRLTSELPPAAIESLRREFGDLLTPGGDLRAAHGLPEEADEPELASLPRLVVDFNRRGFARLHQLIAAINTL